MAEQSVLSETQPAGDFAAVRTAKDRAKFLALATEWRSQHGAMSSISEMSMLPAYQKIIGMGEAAIPLILNELKAEGDEPDQWFWALRAIAEANPVAPQDQGNFTNTSQAWIAWG
jgi:hypothetical protein